MKAKLFKILQFIGALLVIMEGVRQLDSGFYFPWFYFIAGAVMLSMIAILPALNSKYYLTGAVLYFAEAIVLFIIALNYWGDLRKYGAILYITTSILLFLSGFRNIKKS
jgi:hypothetical protein